MHNTRIIILLIFLTSHTAHSSIVIFLQGASRSGKSSICAAIEQYDNWKSVGSLYFSYCLTTFEKLFPDPFACIKNGIAIENIRHAITRNVCVFKKGTSEDMQKAIRQSATHIQSYFNDPILYANHKKDFSNFAYNEIQNQINNNMNVLADVSWYVSQEKIQTIQPTPDLFTVLAYCPFNIILERLLVRNQLALNSGNIMNYRFFHDLIISFSSLYELGVEQEYSIDSMQTATFLDCLNAIEAQLPISETESTRNSGFMMREITRKELQDYRSNFLDKIASKKTFYIIPKINYDLLLRTDEYSSEACTAQIIAYVEKATQHQRA